MTELSLKERFLLADDISDTVSTRLYHIYPGGELYTLLMFLLMSMSTQKDIENYLNVFPPTNKSVNNFLANFTVKCSR